MSVSLRKMSSFIQSCLPPNVRGMTQLDKSQFNVSVTIPLVSVLNSSNITAVLKKINKFKLKIPNFQPIQDSEAGKAIFLDPNLIKGDDLIGITEDINKDFPSPICTLTNGSVDLTFDNFDFNCLIHSILPSNVSMSKFSQIGHIVHLNLRCREELHPYKFIIGQLFLEKNNRCKTVVNKADPVESEFRNIAIELLAGEAEYETEVSEYGFRYKLDYSKVFFNPRLGDEHSRLVHKYFKSPCIVADAFAGIGPFAIPAAKQGCTVFANDLNPDCVHWIKENAVLNKVGLSSVTCLDAGEFLELEMPKLLKNVCNSGTYKCVHIAMNLPAIAYQYVPKLLNIARFCSEHDIILLVHLYMFCSVNLNEPDQECQSTVTSNLPSQCTMKKVDCVNVRSIAPNIDYYCVSFHLNYCGDVFAEPVEKKVKIAD